MHSHIITSNKLIPTPLALLIRNYSIGSVIISLRLDFVMSLMNTINSKTSSSNDCADYLMPSKTTCKKKVASLHSVLISPRSMSYFFLRRTLFYQCPSSFEEGLSNCATTLSHGNTASIALLIMRWDMQLGRTKLA